MQFIVKVHILMLFPICQEREKLYTLSTVFLYFNK
jgi:hypothetical protein